MDTSTLTLAIVLAVVGGLIILGSALDERAEARGRPRPKPFTKQWWFQTGLLLGGSLVFILGVVLDSSVLLIVGGLLLAGILIPVWYRRLQSLF